MRYRWFLIFLLSIFTLTVWSAVWREAPSHYLVVDFLDVGQGDAILITAPNRNQVLIDGGPSRSVVRALSQVMPFYDRSLDLVISSHPDLDHVGGLVEVFKRYQIDGFLEPAFQADTIAYKNLKVAVADEGAVSMIAQKGTKVILAPDVYLEVLSAQPATRGPRGGKPDANNSSIVAKLNYRQTSFLFTGDIPAKLGDKLVITEAKNLGADVLKVSHHGAKTSNSLLFLKTVKPRYAVISVGENNRYGHPSKETLSWLETIKAQVLQTKDLGIITLKSDGVSVGF